VPKKYNRIGGPAPHAFYGRGDSILTIGKSIQMDASPASMISNDEGQNKNMSRL
jgi:hypothetical protein